MRDAARAADDDRACESPRWTTRSANVVVPSSSSLAPSIVANSIAPRRTLSASAPGRRSAARQAGSSSPRRPRQPSEALRRVRAQSVRRCAAELCPTADSAAVARNAVAAIGNTTGSNHGASSGQQRRAARPRAPARRRHATTGPRRRPPAALPARGTREAAEELWRDREQPRSRPRDACADQQPHQRRDHDRRRGATRATQACRRLSSRRGALNRMSHSVSGIGWSVVPNKGGTSAVRARAAEHSACHSSSTST